MSKAYKCDVCGRLFDGCEIMRHELNRQSEVILRYSLGLVFSPENESAPVYPKDLCKECTDSWVEWYKKQRSQYVGKD